MNCEVYENFKKVFSDWKYSVFGVMIFLVFGLIFFMNSNYQLTIGNMGMWFFVIQTITQSLITILFALFIPISLYKFILFSDLSVMENTGSFLGGFFAVIVAGCPACSITLASYIGLAGILSIFPFYGLELKVLTVPILMWANYSILRNLSVCKMKN